MSPLCTWKTRRGTSLGKCSGRLGVEDRKTKYTRETLGLRKHALVDHFFKVPVEAFGLAGRDVPLVGGWVAGGNAMGLGDVDGLPVTLGADPVGLGCPADALGGVPAIAACS